MTFFISQDRILNLIQYLIGIIQIAKSVLGVWIIFVHVGMKLFGKLAISPFNFISFSIFVDTQYFVEVTSKVKKITKIQTLITPNLNTETIV